MGYWVSAESDMYNAVFNAVLQSPLKDRVASINDGAKQDLVKPYIIIGETSITEDVTSTSKREEVAIQMHVYADSKPDCRELLKMLKYYTSDKRRFTLNDYTVEHVRLSNQQVLDDMDVVTSHGVLRLVYTVRHHVLYRNEN